MLFCCKHVILAHLLLYAAAGNTTVLRRRTHNSVFNWFCTEAKDGCLPAHALCANQTQDSFLTVNVTELVITGNNFQCTCEDFFYFDYLSSRCLPGLLKTCQNNADCEDVALVCDVALKRCGCDVENNYLPMSRDRCEKRMCTRDEDCSAGGLHVFSCDLTLGLCRCAPGYFANVTACAEIRGAPCAASGALLSVCWYHGRQSNYYCDPVRRTCQCRPGFYSKLGRCTPGYQSSCSHGRQCSRERNMGENSVCISQKCSCAMGFLYNPRSHLCQSGLHIDCNDDESRCGRFGPAYSCVDGVCECSPNYYIQGDSCQLGRDGQWHC